MAWGGVVWLPKEDEIIDMFARHFEALHRSGAANKAHQAAADLKWTGDHHGHRIWKNVADTVERLRHRERIERRRNFEAP